MRFVYNTFKVRYRDRKEHPPVIHEATVSGPFQHQAEAEAHFMRLPGSHGGTHPGCELVRDEPAVQPAPVADVAKSSPEEIAQ
jgi:hypothetical protein